MLIVCLKNSYLPCSTCSLIYVFKVKTMKQGMKCRGRNGGQLTQRWQWLLTTYLNSHNSNFWVPSCRAMMTRALWKTRTGRTAADAGGGVQVDGCKVKGRLQCSTRSTTRLNAAGPGHCTGWGTRDIISLVSLLLTSLQTVYCWYLTKCGCVPYTHASSPGKAGMLWTVSVA